MYQTVEFKRLLSLVPFATEFQLERAIVDVALANELQVCTVHVLIIAGASRVQSMYRFVDFFAMIPLSLCEVKMILMRKWDLHF